MARTSRQIKRTGTSPYRTPRAKRVRKPSQVASRNQASTAENKRANAFLIRNEGFSKRKKPTFQSKVLKEALPITTRYSVAGSLTSSVGSAKYQEITAELWNDSVLQAILPASTTSESRIWLQNGEIKVQFANFTNAPVEMVVYDWMAKADVPSGITLTTALANGLAARYNASAVNFPHLYPQESKEFMDQYKILKQTKVVLRPGENHIHWHRVSLNKYYDNDLYTNASQPLYVKNISSGVFVRLLGSLTTDSQAMTNVTYASAGVGYIANSKYVYKQPQGTTTVLSYTAGAQPVTSISNQYYMVPEEGGAVFDAIA